MHLKKERFLCGISFLLNSIELEGFKAHSLDLSLLYLDYFFFGNHIQFQKTLNTIYMLIIPNVIFSLGLFPQFQTFLSECLLNISISICNNHLKLNMFKSKPLISFSKSIPPAGDFFIV